MAATMICSSYSSLFSFAFSDLSLATNYQWLAQSLAQPEAQYTDKSRLLLLLLLSLMALQCKVNSCWLGIRCRAVVCVPKQCSLPGWDSRGCPAAIQFNNPNWLRRSGTDAGGGGGCNNSSRQTEQTEHMLERLLAGKTVASVAVLAVLLLFCSSALSGSDVGGSVRFAPLQIESARLPMWWCSPMHGARWLSFRRLCPSPPPPSC